MIRELTNGEIDQLFGEKSYGHLGCCVHPANPYVVPLTYVYKKNQIYSFSFEGQKIDMLRKNPYPCFQVEKKATELKWLSAIAWGEYEELTGDERTEGFSLLIEKFWHEAVEDNPLYLPFRNSARTLEAAKKEENVVLFRINVNKKTGRMEQYEV